MSAEIKQFSIVVAADDDGGIGKNGGIPWPRLKGDMTHFAAITSGTYDRTRVNAVIMGRNTWESLPAKYRPLPRRFNIVVTNSLDVQTEIDDIPGVTHAPSLQIALEIATLPSIESVFVIGGEQIFREALGMAKCGQIYYTRVPGRYECDRFIDAIDLAKYRQVPYDANEFCDCGSEILLYCRTKSDNVPTAPNVAIAERAINAAEQSYLDLVGRVIETGTSRDDRTGVGTLALFGERLEFDLSQGFPLLTTKRVFWRGVAEELLWFISGSTDARKLQAKGVHIWDDNATDYAARRAREGCPVTPGDLGPVYGFQWRHFGAKYRGIEGDLDSSGTRINYAGEGVDQLAAVVRAIVERPTDRRIVMSAWNPADLGEMALPPCHMFCQFFVADKALSCQMYQRSADLGLGVPFNIASYALLTHLIAHVANLRVGKLTMVFGDTHVYKNHVAGLREQLTRAPRQFPRLTIERRSDDGSVAQIGNIDDFTFADLHIEGYNPMPSIKLEMAV